MLLLNETQMHETLDRMAREIAAAAPKGIPLAVVGIRRRGDSLAKRLLPLLEIAGAPARHYGALDITLYRDDLSSVGPQPVLRGTEIDFNVTDTWMVLVDDVLYTGRSVRAALDALKDLGRPKAVRLAVLVDRGWRELPIQADFAGLRVPTEAHHIVKVKVREIDEAEQVDLVSTLEH